MIALLGAWLNTWQLIAIICLIVLVIIWIVMKQRG